MSFSTSVEPGSRICLLSFPLTWNNNWDIRLQNVSEGYSQRSNTRPKTSATHTQADFPRSHGCHLVFWLLLHLRLSFAFYVRLLPAVTRKGNVCRQYGGERPGEGRAHRAVTNYLLPQSLAVRGWKSECLSKAQLHFPLSQNKIPSEFLIWAEGDSRRGIRDNLKLSLVGKDSEKDLGIFMLFLHFSPIFLEKPFCVVVNLILYKFN